MLPAKTTEIRKRILTLSQVKSIQIAEVILKTHELLMCGQGSSVGIATDYGLDDPRSNLGGDEIFRPTRPALGPTHPPVKWVPGLSRG